MKRGDTEEESKTKLPSIAIRQQNSFNVEYPKVKQRGTQDLTAFKKDLVDDNNFDEPAVNPLNRIKDLPRSPTRSPKGAQSPGGFSSQFNDYSDEEDGFT
jgi:hypothetical protein